MIFVIALVFRLAPLNRYVTPDEPAWVYRSIRFSQALAAGDLTAIPTTGHPGVTTMWLGSAGLQIHRWLAPDQAAAHLDWLDGLAGLSPKSPAAFYHLALFLPAGRVLVALATSLGLVGVFILARRLWGQPVGLLAAFLLALDPFLAGHSGLLHLDGLLTTTMTLSVLAALLAVSPSRPSYRWIAFSGLLAGLALLTKTPGGFLLPFTGLLLLAAWLTRRISWRQALVTLALWTLVAGLTFLALYPAMWADPLATVRGLFDVGGRHVEGAIRPIFFHGQTTFDPAPTFYLVVWLFRVSPLVLIGLPIALIVNLRRPGPRRFATFTLIALALGFGLFVILVGKKHDRYLLPAFPPLTLVAALGWEQVRESVIRRSGNSAPNPESPNLLIPATLILIQLFLTLPYLSAPLGYFNPLLGGPKAALDWLDVGWGEGQGAAARWLNGRPDAENLIVATSSIPPFASLFVGQTVLLSEATLSQADYVVSPLAQDTSQLYITSETQAPVFDYNVGGIAYSRIVRNPVPDEQVAFLSEHTCQNDLIILDAESALAHRYDGPAGLVVLADAPDATQVAARVEALLPGHERLWYVALPTASPVTAQHVKAQLACYGQTVFTETVSGVTIVRLRLTNVSQINLDTTHHTPRSTQHVSRFGDALALTDAHLPTSVAWPDHLFPVVRWETLAPIPSDYRVVWYLKDQAGRIWVEGGQEILDTNYRLPSAWTPGDWSDQTFLLALPPAIPPGRYTVELGVFDPDTDVRLSVWHADGNFAGLSVSLGQTTIVPPPRPPSPWDMIVPQRLDPPLVAGPLVLLGCDPPPSQVGSGEQTSFDLFWQASAAPGADYALRWRLSLPQGEIALEKTVPFSPYPTARWRAGELEQARYDLPVSPNLPAGDYNLAVNVLAPDGSSLWADDAILAPVEILSRDRLFSLPTGIAYPLDLRLGSVVHLRGFDLETLSARPGDQLPLTLYWQADGPTDLSYAVFVHLRGPDGMNHGQVDRPPAAGAAPTHTWAPDQVIVDEISLPVLADAPPGTYHIAVGLYDPVSGDRLSVYDAAGTELPGGQIVLPLEIEVKVEVEKDD